MIECFCLTSNLLDCYLCWMKAEDGRCIDLKRKTNMPKFDQCWLMRITRVAESSAAKSKEEEIVHPGALCLC